MAEPEERVPDTHFDKLDKMMGQEIPQHPLRRYTSMDLPLQWLGIVAFLVLCLVFAIWQIIVATSEGRTPFNPDPTIDAITRPK